MTKASEDLRAWLADSGRTCSPTQAATRMGQSPRRVREMCARGEIPAIRFGNRWVIPIVELERFLEIDARLEGIERTINEIRADVRAMATEARQLNVKKAR